MLSYLSLVVYLTVKTEGNGAPPPFFATTR
jgi:hypothetical protein